MPEPTDNSIWISLVGNVMVGRGIDQVLPHPCDPTLHEPKIKDAREYVRRAERRNGHIDKPVDYAYPWGDALETWKRFAPDVRLINLETAITRSETFNTGKNRHFRLHPGNMELLRSAQINICNLANNHVLDWGRSGLQDTLTHLDLHGVQRFGAGRNLEEARAPGIIELPTRGRILCFAVGHRSSGVRYRSAARPECAGVSRVDDLSEKNARRLGEQIAIARRPGDLVLVSIHWGERWGHGVPADFKRFARSLIAWANVDIVHGHAAHHVKGIEVYHGRPIFYGTGNFLNDYEGIRGHEEFRSELGLIYFVRLSTRGGSLCELKMVPTRIKNFRVQHASQEEALWLAETLNREGLDLGTSVMLDEEGCLSLKWS